MRPVAAAVLLLGALLAGCSDPEPSALSDSAFDDLDLEVSATTGAIRGVVVDERIVPIAGASVALTGGAAEQAAMSDDQGRFTFSNLAPGVYFLAAQAALHEPAQTSVDVVAGVAEPPVTKLLLTRLFTQEPFVEQVKNDGFIQCNQAGIVYASAPCVTDFTGLAGSNLNGTVPGCTPGGCAPQLRRILTEQRGFTYAVGPGWQQIVQEMTWQESSDTFSRMGITFSYNETQRIASHWYARSDSTSPLRMQIDVGVVHPDAQIPEGYPDRIPAEGHPDLYYFVGVRQDTFPVPAVAVNQNFQIFSTAFYYGLPPVDWSIVNGDPLPF
jgi:Carboxypeptidase regulatory-like domain